MQSRIIGNFSFKNSHPTGSRYACVGDSACFIDPVFSSGVTLAIQSALHVCELLLPALRENREAVPTLLQPVNQALARGYDTFAALVYRFYNTRFVDNLIFGAPGDGAYHAGVVSVLAGDVFRIDNPFAELLLSSRRHESRQTSANVDGTESIAYAETSLP